MVTVIKQTNRNNAIVAISQNNPEKAQIAVMETKVEYYFDELTLSTFSREHKRVAYINGDTKDFVGKYQENQELPGQVVTLTSYTPFFEGQQPKMKQDEQGNWTIPFTDEQGRLVYTRNVYDASGKMEDKIVDAAQLRALAEARKNGTLVTNKAVIEEPIGEPQEF